MRGTKNLSIRCLTALMLAAPAAVLAGPADLSTIAGSPGTLDISNAEIGRIKIFNGSIFDLDDQAENRTLYRFANRAHITTRPEVIKTQLLFDSGDRFSAQQIEESERLLRANRYLNDVSITPVIAATGLIDINVTTSDVWTLIPKIDVARSGGENKSAVGIKEMNLLGTGMAVELQYKKDVDRDSTSLKLVDRNLGHSRYAIQTQIARNSDGHNWYLQLEKPFYALDSRDAKGFLFLDNDRVESFYDRGERLSDYRHQARHFESYLGWSKGLQQGWTRRWLAGLAYEDHTFSAFNDPISPAPLVPENRTLVYPFVGVEWVEDKYEKASNYEQISRTEDRFLGTRVSARVGLAGESAGSDRDAVMLNAAVQSGFGSSEKRSLILAANLNSRIEDGDPRNLSLEASARYYRRQSDHRLLYASLSGTYGHNLDLEQNLMLGGDNGLRGYPLRYQSGDKRALLTVEQRFFSEWYPFRLIHVGGAVFFDAGRAWGESPQSTASNGWLKDVGFGLRLANSRSGFGRMTHIDVAFPLDGDADTSDVQFLISTKKSF